MDHFLKLVAVVLPLFFACETMASPVSYQFRGMNVTREGGVSYIRGMSPSEMAAAAADVVGGAVKGTGAATVAGTTATFGASATLGGAASSALKGALRATPGIAGVALTAWLLQNGFEYLQGQWQKRQTGDDPYKCFSNCFIWEGRSTNGLAFQGNTPQDVVDKVATYQAPLYPGWTVQLSTYIGEPSILVKLPNGNVASNAQMTKVQSRAPDNASLAPATNQDWDNLPAPTDAAYKEALQNGVKLPVDNVTSNPASKDVALGNPYVDPVTGKRYQDNARVTPQSGGTTAEVSAFKQEVDSNGQPVTSGGGAAPPEKQEDPCKVNPDASACKPLDEVEDTELQNKDINLSLIPLPGFGPSSASCPAPQNLFNSGGQQVSWDWSKFCQFSLGIRPLMIGFAWIAAIMMVVGVARRDA